MVRSGCRARNKDNIITSDKTFKITRNRVIYVYVGCRVGGGGDVYLFRILMRFLISPATKRYRSREIDDGIVDCMSGVAHRTDRESASRKVRYSLFYPRQNVSSERVRMVDVCGRQC